MGTILTDIQPGLFMPSHTHLSGGDTISVGSRSKLRVTRKLSYLGKFGMLYQYAAHKVGTEAPHAGATLFLLLSRITHENQLYFNSAELSPQLGVKKATLENHFHQLRAIGAIVPDPIQEHRKRGIVLWRVCPFLAWVGSGDSMRDYLQTLPEDHPFFSFAEHGELIDD